MCPSGSGSSGLQILVEARWGGLVTCTFVPLYQGSSAILEPLFAVSHVSSIPRQSWYKARETSLLLLQQYLGLFDTYTSTSSEKTNFKNSLHNFSSAYKNKKRAFNRKPATARLMLWLWDIHPALEREGKRHQQTEKTVNQEWSWHVGRLLILLSIQELKIRKTQIITSRCSTTAVGVAVWKHVV